MARKLLLLLALCSCLALSEFAFADCNASFVCPFGETISCSLVGAGTCSSGAADGENRKQPDLEAREAETLSTSW